MGRLFCSSFFFFCGGRAMWLGATGTLLDLEVLLTDSLARRVASINLEKDGEDKFSKNTLYSSTISWRQALTRTSSSTVLQQYRALRWNLLIYVSRFLVGYYLVLPNSVREDFIQHRNICYWIGTPDAPSYGLNLTSNRRTRCKLYQSWILYHASLTGFLASSFCYLFCFFFLKFFSFLQYDILLALAIV